jgi:hypothetical protein
MTDEGSLISAGRRMVNRNKRYIFWFWLLNLTLAQFGTAAFRNQAHGVLDHSLLSDRLVHGFDLPVFAELLTRPETGSMAGSAKSAMYFAILFFVASLLLMPGVLEGYTSEGRLSREEFFRTCGRNLWRFVRLLLFFLIIAGPIAVVVFFVVLPALEKAAGLSTNEKMPFYTQLVALLMTFLIMTTIRIWFDLAQVDVVVRDQNAVRRSVAVGFRYTRRHVFRLLFAYVAVALVALLVLVAGVWAWHLLVPPSSVLGAFLISQIMLILLLWSRFWQRAAAAAYHLREASVAVSAAPLPEPVPLPGPAAPLVPPAPEGTAPA